MRPLPPVPSPYPTQTFRFGRMFAPTRFPSTTVALRALSETMQNTAAKPTQESKIPAGFIYLAQFVAHDISYDQTQGIPSGFLRPEEIINGRSPALDLDSIYGHGPRFSPALYEVDKLRLRLGKTTGGLPNDLPSRPTGPHHPRQALIGDPRNDDNLALAQTHVAFLHFHNQIVAKLQQSGMRPPYLFTEARKRVVQHYQSIVLCDLVPKITDPQVYNDVMQHGRKCFFPRGIPKGVAPYMPVEFSVAAYRLDSMIPGKYEWNKTYSGTQNSMTLEQLFSWSKATLQDDAVVDWRRFYDFSQLLQGQCLPKMNRTHFLDTSLAPAIWQLPPLPVSHARAGQPRSLAALHLSRGRSYRLATGQEVVQAMQAKGIQVHALTSDHLATEPHKKLMHQYHFDKYTPLWYYILKEAEIQGQGKHLGPVGSRIVVETFHGLIEGSRYSIMKTRGWKPMQGDKFIMVDLLQFANVVNPLDKN